jgi:hypothetical protein
MSTMACQSFFGESGIFSATQMSGSVTVVARVSYTTTDVLNAYGIIIVPATSGAAQVSNHFSLAQRIARMYLDTKLEFFEIALTIALVERTEHRGQGWYWWWYSCNSFVGFGRNLGLPHSPETKKISS